MCPLQRAGLSTWHLPSAAVSPLEWKPDPLRLAFDSTAKDNVLGNGGKTGRKEPGTPADRVGPRSLHTQPGLFREKGYILSVTLWLDLFVTTASPFPLSYTQDIIIVHQEKGSNKLGRG